MTDINAVPVPRADTQLTGLTTLAVLYSISVLSRSLLIAVVPLDAYALLGEARLVSILYFAASAFGVVASLVIPWLVREFRRRWVLTLGAVCLGIAPLAMAMRTLPWLVSGLVVQVVGIAAVEITLNLYALDRFHRGQLGRYEPLRIFFAAAAFAFGPWIGVHLGKALAHWVPFALAAAVAALLLAGFWALRLAEHPDVAPMRRPPPNPLRYVPRFFGQPRLRLAFALASGRSAWWSMFYIYAPIYVVASGLDETIGGAVVSVGLVWLFLAPLWGRVARKIGMRHLLLLGYTACGVFSLAAALIENAPWLTVCCLLAAAFGAAILDGSGNVPFLRAVRPFERPEMTTVFTTYRDFGQTVPPGIFALLLKAFELPVVFLAGGAGMLVLAYFSRHIPRRL